MNQLTTLLLVLFASTTLLSQTINIPDANFLKKLIEAGVDVNNNGTIQSFEATAVKVLDVSKTDTLVNISSLEGIGSFPNIEELDCSGHILLTNLLAFPQNKKLKKLIINNIGGGKKTIDLSANLDLEELDCSSANVESVNVTQNVKLRIFICHTNQLRDLDVSKNIGLINLYCYNNKFKDLDVSKNSKLRNLDFTENRLKEIDVSANRELLSLVCGVNSLSELDLSKNDSLKLLFCYANSISDLDLRTNKKLERLWCSNSSLSWNDKLNLDISENYELTDLYCGNNKLGTLDIRHLVKLEKLSCNSNNLKELDISNNLKLRILDLSYNRVDSLDISEHLDLENFSCAGTNIDTIDLSQNTKLVHLSCGQNRLESLDLSKNIFLETISCSYNNIALLDIRNNPFVTELYCFGMRSLIALYLRNGSNEKVNFGGSFNLQYLCVDGFEQDYVQHRLDSVLNTVSNAYPIHSLQLETDCTEFYKLSGRTNVEIVKACEERVPVREIKYHVSGIDYKESSLANSNGLFSSLFPEGSYKVVPHVMNAPYYKIEPESVAVTLTEQNSLEVHQFCLYADTLIKDLNLSLYNTNRVRPGLEGRYKIKISNNGTTVESGEVKLFYNDERINLISAEPEPLTEAENGIVWIFKELMPFEERCYDFTMLLNGPQDTPALNGGDVLKYWATITPLETDFKRADNYVELCQEVRNSFDPNDKTCLQGDAILEERVGEYAFYRIRFENTGSAEAIDVLIKDEIDQEKFDINTLQITESSHEMQTRIVEGNIIEFYFEDINLAYEGEENKGYVIFKLRTLSTLELGDKFENSAEIYFDNNFPIYTNTTSTTIISEPLEEELGDKNFLLKVFPNPSSGILNISSSEDIQEYYIYDLQGKVVDRGVYIEAIREVATLKLDSGLYLVQVITEEGIEVNKVLVEQ